MVSIKKIKVRNMESVNGRDVPNQFIIETQKEIIFQSYSSIIAIKKQGKIYLDKNKWDYSVTTGKYRNQFLVENKKETERKIKEKICFIVDLNKD